MENSIYENNLEGLCEDAVPRGADKKKDGLSELDWKMLVDLGILAAGATAAITGIIGPESGGYQGGRNELYNAASATLKDIHSISGYAFAGLSTLHLAQHYNQIKCYVKSRYNRIVNHKNSN